MKKKILLTGGAGFIGSHTAVALLNEGCEVVIYDNLCNSDPSVIDGISQIAGQRPEFIEGDIRDKERLTAALDDVDAVVHFAGLKAVGESVQKPLEYFDNNVNGTVVLLEAMRTKKVKCLVFSSSATVYGKEAKVPYVESSPLGNPSNPYGRTKVFIEEMLKDCCFADKTFSAVCLRYFNPIGAHPSGLIGENPRGTPNNLMPYLMKVASGELPYLRVFGADYATPDGTGVRDYIHVMDLAEGHTAAIPYALKHKGWKAINLGSGIGYSVFDVVHMVEKVTGKAIAYKVEPRRTGDLPAFWCNPKLARELLGWQAMRTLEDMCRDAWHFTQMHCGISRN
jgi:UDP-glucose 4-epimerase